MHHALFLPPFGEFADPRVTVDLAVTAEATGWDGMFLWDHIWRPPDQVSGVGDVWISLAAIASATTRLRLGPGVTPLTRRPRKLRARRSRWITFPRVGSLSASASA